ncbi:twin-arginine translocation signal domain-containing protein [Haladaptatus sp. NG-SE-30]
MTDVNRRRFLKQTGVAATGLGTLGTGITSAERYGIPIVSTRGHFDDDGNRVSWETETSYDTTGDVPGVDVGCVDDLTVFIHGWHKKGDDPEQDAKEKFLDAKNSLENAGYTGTLIGYSWDNDAGSGDWDYGWGTAQEVAQQNGAKLAQFVLDYKLACPSSTLRFVSHSLGAQVVLSSLRNLDVNSTWDAYGYEVYSIHMLGAAQDNEAPTTEWSDTYYAIRNESTATFNYHSHEDDVLQWIYNSYEFDQALGETGYESGNTPAPNYNEFDVTSQVGDDHSGYLDNLGDEIVSHMNNVPAYD